MFEYNFFIFEIRFEKGNHTILHINVSDSVEADLYSSFERICVFIGELNVFFSTFFRCYLLLLVTICLLILCLLSCCKCFPFSLSSQHWICSFDLFKSWNKPLQCCGHGFSFAPLEIYTGGKLCLCTLRSSLECVIEIEEVQAVPVPVFGI